MKNKLRALLLVIMMSTTEEAPGSTWSSIHNHLAQATATGQDFEAQPPPPRWIMPAALSLLLFLPLYTWLRHRYLSRLPFYGRSR